MSDLDMSNPHHVMVLFMAGLFILTIFAYLFSFAQGGAGSPTKRPVDPKAKFLVPKEGGALQKYSDAEGQCFFKLIKRIKVSEDTLIYRFGFPDEKMPFGLPIGQHVVFTATTPTPKHPEGEEIQRKYTPISPLSDRGFVDFLIKVYRPNIHPKFPEGGMMSQFVDRLKIGDTMQMEGPKGRLRYEGFGDFVVSKMNLTGKTKIGCISGGTGITPCYQIIQAVLQNNDKPTVSLVFGNRTINDILLKDELQQLQTNHPEKFKLFFTVDIQPDAKEDWNQGVGFITKEMLQKSMPPPSPETLIVFCGPPLFEKDQKQFLKELGYDEKTMVFKF